MTSDGRVRLAIVGVGKVGRAALELAATREWLEPVALIVQRPEHDGRPASELVAGLPASLRLTTGIEQTLEVTRPEVVIVATRSALSEVLPVLELAAASGARAVLSTSEELAHVAAGDSEDGDRVRALPAAHGVTLVATGVNPGFVLDLWPIVLSGLAWDVETLHARRTVDVSVFAPGTRRKLGIGHLPPEFQAGVRDGTITGHVGFRESLRRLCSAMGREPERLVVETTPIVAADRITLADGVVEPGETAGATQRAEAWVGGRPWISVELTLHVRPEAAGLRPTDAAELSGRHHLRVEVDPGCSPILSTAALVVNTIPTAMRAAPGLYGPGDLPPAAPWLAATPPPDLPRVARSTGGAYPR